MANEEYELLPHKLLSDLKFDVEALKKKLTQPDTKMNELILEIESMKDAIHELNVVFEKALEQTKGEDPVQNMNALNQRLETVVTQNETIAKGMIAISDKLEGFMARQRSTQPLPVQHSMGPPVSAGRMAPRPEMSDLPPPPPEKEKKKRGLFR